MSNRLLAGRYELIEKIGEGGMAVVYKARCRLLNRYVAIKILRPEFTKDESFIESFKKESQAAAGLSHPNIVSVYDVGKEGNLHFIVMELVEGKPLSQLISEKGRLDYKEAIEITKQVASALSLAHKNQIIHRDVKPHNILITSTGVAKLADFGIAQAVSNSTMVAGKDNKVMGSVHYLSPEQARGSYVDERTDIYSLGIVLYEMLTGKVPFDGDNPISIALMHINDPITPPSRLVSGIPPQLEKIVMKATDKYQNNRYSTADEMIRDLDNIEFITKVMGNKIFVDDPSQNPSAGEKERVQGGVFGEGIDEKSIFSEVDQDSGHSGKGGKDGKGGKSGKSGKGSNTRLIAIIVVAAVIVFGAGIFALGSAMGWFGGDSEDIPVPDLKGKTVEEAQAELEELGLVLQEGEQVYSPDQEEGKITSQMPSEGTVVAKGQTVTVNVSKGKKDGVVPSILDKDYKEAEAYLAEFGFQLGEIKTVNSPKPKGIILSQTPGAGQKAASGTRIDIEISDGAGKEMTKVPNLTGKTKEQADAAIAAAGLVVDIDNISYEENDLAPANTVIAQYPVAYTEVETGSKVSYRLTKAPEVVPPAEGGDDGDGSGEEGNGAEGGDGDDAGDDGEE
ncbi:MAG: Stk1 family PASTA domain-containing Ser/Thr kinase [Anaerovoracaceae bacterium]